MKTLTTRNTVTLALLLGLGGCYERADDRPSADDSDGSSSDDGADSDPTTPDPTTTPSSDDGNDDDSAGTDDGGPVMPEPGNAMIRVIHGSPDAPAVDIYVAGDPNPVIAGLAYGETSVWLEVPAATYSFEVRAADAAPTDAPVYSTGNLELADGAMISALAAGTLGEGAGAAFRVIPIAEAFEPAPGGQARVRVIHAGADAPTVGLDVGNDGTAEIAELERFAETGAAGVALPAGDSLQLGIQVGGETFTSFTLPALGEGDEVIAIATGLVNRLPRENEGFAVLLVGPEGTLGLVKQNPMVYALHAGPDAPEVDLCVGSLNIANHIFFGSLVGTQVPPGSYDVQAYASPSGCVGTPALEDELDNLEAGESYLVVATGELAPAVGEPPLQLQMYGESFSLDQPGQAGLRLVHAASAPEVDVGIVTGGVIEGGNVISEGLKWPDVTAELMVPPLTYQLGVAGAGGSTPITPLVDFHVPIDGGQRAFVVAAGDVFPEKGEAHFRLMVIDTATQPWSIAEISPNL
jgi:hypothetical protein